MDVGSQKTIIEKETVFFFPGWFLTCYSWSWPKIDLILFSSYFCWGVVLLYINFPSSKNPAPSSSWGLSLTWRDGKTSGSLSWFLESLLQKNKATLVSFKKTLTHKDIVEIVSQVVTSKNKTGETICSINLFFPWIDWTGQR